MNAMKLMRWAVGLTLVLVGCAHPQSERVSGAEPNEGIVTEKVVYRDYHDPMVLELTDGRQLQVAPPGFAFERVNRWSTGRALLVAYSAQRGAVVIDSETGSHLAVLAGFGERHPLDLLLERSLRLAVNQLDHVEAYDVSARHWDAETKRIEDFILCDERVHEAGQRAVRRARQAWAAYRKEQRGMVRQLYTLPGGTIWTLYAAQHQHQVARDHAREWMELVDVVISADSERR